MPQRGTCSFGSVQPVTTTYSIRLSFLVGIRYHGWDDKSIRLKEVFSPWPRLINRFNMMGESMDMLSHPPLEIIASLEKKLAAMEARETRLVAENTLLQQLYERAPLAYQSLDPDGCLIAVNQTWLDTLGYARDEVIGRHFGDFLHPDRQDHFKENITKFTAISEILGLAFKMISKDGSTLFVSFSSQISTDSEGRCQQTHCIFQDITQHKRDQEALRESEERFRALHNASFGGIVIHDQGIILDCNKGLSDQTGYTLEELIGMDGLMLIDPECRDLVQHNIKSGFAQTYETTGLRKDGSRYPVSIRGANIPYKGLTVRVSEFRDITEYKRLEEALEKRLVTLTCPLNQTNGIIFEDLFDPAVIQRIQDEFAAATGVASIITHPDGTPLTAPSNFTHLCSEIIRNTDQGCANCFKSDAVIGRHHPGGPIVQQCLSGGLWDAGASITVGGQHIANWLIGQVRNKTQSDDSMLAYAHAIGADETAFMQAFHAVPSMSQERFEHIAQALFTLANQLSSAAYQNIQQARSITERKQAEKALRESEERFRLAMEATKDGLWDWDITSGDVYYSPNYWLMLGYNADTRPRSAAAWAELLHPDDKEAMLAANNDCIENRCETILIEYRMRTCEGNWKWIQGRGKAVERDEKGHALRMIGTHIDITERKQAEKEQERLKTQLLQSQKLESVARLAGGIAHDFNNMLTVIQGHADLAIMNMQPKDPYFRRFNAIRDIVQRSTDLTRQLLAFARKQTIALKVLDLNETIESMLSMLKRLIGEDINLSWMPGASLWTVKADPSQIDQILANLCVNARDAIVGVGRIIVETGNVTFNEEYCAAHAGFLPGEYVQISVSDNGCGMDKLTLANIFEPFFTTKGVAKGTGLGLATVYGAVKQNDGFINVYSEPEQGSVFTIYLRRHAGAVVQAMTGDTSLPIDRGHETILLVEDEPAILEMTTAMLQHLGYTVLAANGPREALRLVSEHDRKIDLLLTDVIMPEMNGRDLAERLKVHQPWVKRLFMSGYTADIIANQGVLDEGVHFIQKPFSHTALGAKIRKALESNEEEKSI